VTKVGAELVEKAGISVKDLVKRLVRAASAEFPALPLLCGIWGQAAHEAWKIAPSNASLHGQFTPEILDQPRLARGGDGGADRRQPAVRIGLFALRDGVKLFLQPLGDRAGPCR